MQMLFNFFVQYVSSWIKAFSLIQGIEASRLLESEGIQTHLTFVYRYMQLANKSFFSNITGIC